MEIEPVSSYGLGYHARQQGTPRGDNPFKPIGDMHGNWLMGWDHCEEELAGSKPRKPTKLISVKLVK